MSKPNPASPVDAVQLAQKDYIFYYSSEGILTLKHGSLQDGYETGDLRVDSKNVVFPPEQLDEADLAVTLALDGDSKPASIRVYYNDKDMNILEAIGDLANDKLAFKKGGFTDKNYKLANGSTIGADSESNWKLNVFFISQSNREWISRAHNDGGQDWELKEIH